MRYTPAALLLLALTVTSCAGASTASSPLLGRALTSQPSRATPPPAPGGDPPAERGGTLPPRQAASAITPSAHSAAASPRAALRRYALAYANWDANNLLAHTRALASLAVGAARLADEQTTASQSRFKELAAHHVRNRGLVLSIAPGEARAHGQWIIVTLEQTTGTGPYASLPALPHVTLARAVRLGQRWSIAEWNPQT